MKNNTAGKLIGAASLCVLSSLASAEETFSYSYISGVYSFLGAEARNLPEDFTGAGVGLAFGIDISPSIALTASYVTSVVDASTFKGELVDLETDTYSLGLAFHRPLSEKIDWIAGLNISRAEAVTEAHINGAFDAPDRTEEDLSGHALYTGLRHKNSDKTELNVSVSRLSVESQNSTILELGFSYYFTQAFTWDISYAFSSEARATNLSLTKYF